MQKIFDHPFTITTSPALRFAGAAVDSSCPWLKIDGIDTHEQHKDEQPFSFTPMDNLELLIRIIGISLTCVRTNKQC